MKPSNFLTSACRYCRCYKLEGRRGGMCQILGVPVQGSWKACALASPAFASSWEGLEEIMISPNKTPVLTDAHSLACALDNSAIELTEEMASFTSEPKKAAPLLV